MENKEIKNSTMAIYLSITHKLIVTKVYKSFAWASSIMANVPICHVGNPSSILGLPQWQYKKWKKKK